MNKPVGKWTKSVNGQFTEKQIQMSEKQGKILKFTQSEGNAN